MKALSGIGRGAAAGAAGTTALSAVPHLAYGLVTALVLEDLDSR